MKLDPTYSRRAPLKPVVRWAGGKSSMVGSLVDLVPNDIKRYYEPMVGGAALFFQLRPRRARLADVNPDLIAFYSVLRTQGSELVSRLMTLKASADTYYSLRATVPGDEMSRAIRFAYLNRLAWNGLYRVNRQGQFNVPIGDRLPASMWSAETLMEASSALRSASLRVEDFRFTCMNAQPKDFVFLDPPYARGSQSDGGFNRYTADTFTLDDHRDLAGIVCDLSRRNVYVMLTLGDSAALTSLYPAALRTHRVKSKALIACNGSARRNVDELILLNY